MEIFEEKSDFIDPEQAWFWSERWQRMEQEVDEDLEAGRVEEYANVEEALTALDQIMNLPISEDKADPELTGNGCGLIGE